MSFEKCPLCGSTECKIEDGTDFLQIIRCKSFGITVRIVDDLFEDCKGKKLSQILNLIFEFAIRRPLAEGKRYWTFYYDDNQIEPSSDNTYINLAPYMHNYPKSVIEKADRVLLNLALLHGNYGVPFTYEVNEARIYFPDDICSKADCKGMLRILVDLGYVCENNSKDSYVITVQGWKHIEDLRKQNIETKQAFIAMSFRDETKEIREGFRQAISDMGYSAVIIDEKEHNNQIVPEIFFEIERSKFVVVDVTFPNYGAYYEAGYAQGLGKQVIVCCKKAAFENSDGSYTRPHFDISQKSMVIWDDIDDLIFRLKKRISATIR